MERKLCSIALSHLGEDAEPSKTVEVVSKLTIDYLQEVDFSALQQGRLFAVFNLMILLLGHKLHLDTCADLIQNKIFCKFISTLSTDVRIYVHAIWACLFNVHVHTCTYHTCTYMREFAFCSA